LRLRVGFEEPRVRHGQELKQVSAQHTAHSAQRSPLTWHVHLRLWGQLQHLLPSQHLVLRVSDHQLLQYVHGRAGALSQPGDGAEGPAAKGVAHPGVQWVCFGGARWLRRCTAVWCEQALVCLLRSRAG